MMNPQLDKKLFDSISSFSSEIEKICNRRSEKPFSEEFSRMTPFGQTMMSLVFGQRGWCLIGFVGDMHINFRRGGVLHINDRHDIEDGPRYITKDSVLFAINNSLSMFDIEALNDMYDLTLPLDYFQWTNDDILMLRMCV